MTSSPSKTLGFPDPKVSSLLDATKFFQRYQCPTTVFRVLHRRIFSSCHHEWELLIEYSNYNINSFSTLKAKLQSHFNRIGGLITTLSLSEASIGYLWSVGLKPMSCKMEKEESQLILSNRLKNSKISSKVYGSRNLIDSRRKIQESKCAPQVLVSRLGSDVLVNIEDVLESDLCKRLIHNGKNVTRRYTTRGSLCNAIFKLIRNNIQKGWTYIRELISCAKKQKNKKLSARSKVEFVKAETLQPLGFSITYPIKKEATPLKQTTSSVCGTMIPFNYQKLEFDRQIKDPRVFRAVRMYLVQHIHLLDNYSWSTTIRGRSDSSTVETLHIIRAAGLPTGSTLWKMYQEYCTSLDPHLSVQVLKDDLNKKDSFFL